MKEFLKPSPEWDQANFLFPGGTGESQAGRRGRAEKKVLSCGEGGSQRELIEWPRHKCPVLSSKMGGSQSMVPGSLRSKLFS